LAHEIFDSNRDFRKYRFARRLEFVHVGVMLAKTPTLADRAFEELRHDIVSGVFGPRQPLRLVELKARYGMGFSPLREALNRLAAGRFVVSEPNCGFKVASLSLDEMWDATRTRILIETEALSLAIRKGDDAWETGIVGALYALNRQAERPHDPHADGAEVLRMLEARHYAFHRALVAACGSKWLLDIFQTLYLETARYRAPALASARDEADRDIRAEHGALADAALARDVNGACALLAAHYTRTAASVEASMG
jgi:DNA-binding GntR family transcriptional regulator